MVRDDNVIMSLLYRGTTTALDFCWNNLVPNVPMLNLISQQDIESIRTLITSARWSGNNKAKMQKIDELMNIRGFRRFAGGTNRLVYEHPATPAVIYKVAIDSVGINDNPAEFYNQDLIKPYCTKVYECSPCGTIASFERVDRITTIDEYYSIADDYFYLLSRVILGKYIMEDIGIDYFMNVGIRRNFGPVLLDFPYCYELDGRKLYCQQVNPDTGIVCGGEIDYDAGFNKLVCSKCGAVYRARDLAKDASSRGVLLRSKGARKMKINIKRGNEVVKTIDTTEERDFISRNNTATKKAPIKTSKVAKVVLKRVATPVKTEEEVPVSRLNNVVPLSVRRKMAEKAKVHQPRPIKRLKISVGKKVVDVNPVKHIVKVSLKGTKAASTAAVLKEATTSPVEKAVPANVHENTVAKRVICVSVGKKTPAGIAGNVTTDKTESKIKVNLTGRKPKEVAAPKVEEEKIEKVASVTINGRTASIPSHVAEETEAKVEVVKEEETAENSKEIEAGLDQTEEKSVTLDLTNGTIIENPEPEKEEVEEKVATSNTSYMNQTRDSKGRFGHKKTEEEVKVEETVVDEAPVEEETNSELSFEDIVKAREEVEMKPAVMFDTEPEENAKAEDAPVEEAAAEAMSEEEDFVYEIVTELPENADPSKVYAVALVENPKEEPNAESEEYVFYAWLPADDTIAEGFYRIAYDKEEDAWVVVNDEDEEEAESEAIQEELPEAVGQKVSLFDLE